MKGKAEVGRRKGEVKTASLYFSILHFSFLLSSLPAAEPPVLVELAPISPNVRLGKPMPTVWDVTKRQPGLLEGKLEFRIHLGQQLFYVFTTDELVLHAPDQRMRFLFPAITDDVQTPELEVDVTWIAKSGRIPLRMQLLRVPFTARKTMMMVVGEQRGPQGRSAAWDDRLTSLQVESLATNETRARVANRADFQPLQTVTAAWDANLFPHEPLAYVPYDVVAVSGEIFGALRRQQLEAMETWVRAGGRLYLEADGLLERSHVDFLNRLTGREFPEWSLDRVGKLEWPMSIAGEDYRAVVDLGRFVIRNPEASFPEISQTARRFLWDVPPGIDPVRQLSVSLAPSQVGLWRGNQRGIKLEPSLFEQLQKALMPSGVQLVPFSLIALLLGGLVVVIGPGEWWLLGRLRLRRFTWLTWPAATVAVTVITVTLSNWFMSASGQARYLEITDLGADGRVVRSQRFELVFPSQSRDVQSDVARGFWRVVERPPREELLQFQVVPAPAGQQGRLLPLNREQQSDARLTSPNFEGRVPSQYTATQTVPQWTPRLSHRYELPSQDTAAPIDWTAMTPLLPNGRFLDPKLAAEISQQLGAKASGIVVNRDTISGANDGLLNLLCALTVENAHHGNQRWVPLADRFGWSDLTLLSPTGPYDAAILIIVPQDHGWTCYRRPYSSTSVMTR